MRRGAPKALEALPGEARPLVERLLAQAERSALGVHLVGGPVRDFLLGRPLRDVDLLVEARGEIGAAELARAAAPPGARVTAHTRFGTVRLEVDGVALDLATARAEHYPHPGALPEVRAGSLEEDLRRRDFTVNALAVPLSGVARRGRPPLVDTATGLADLEAGVLRVFHPGSFRDDPTRALRAARLAPRLGFRLARSSASALRSALREGAFGAVSGERLRAELEKLFEEAPLGLDPARALRLLADWHVLAAIEPGLELPAASAAPLRRLGRAIAEPPWEGERARPLLCGLMLWFGELPAPLRRASLARLAVEGAPAAAVSAFPATRDRLLRSLGASRGRGACDALLAPLGAELLLALYASAAPAVRRRIVRWAREDRSEPLPIRGDELVALGLRGQAVGAALARLRAAWLDRAVRTPEDLLGLAQELARRSRVAHTRRASPRKPRSSAE